MNEYARTTNSLPTILNPIVYFRLSAWVLAAVAVLGSVLSILGAGMLMSAHHTFLDFTWAHNIVHFVLAAAAFLFGYAALPGPTVKLFSIIFGGVYLVLGVAGFFTLQAPDPFLSLTPALNGIHLALGGYGLAAGLLAKF